MRWFLGMNLRSQAFLQHRSLQLQKTSLRGRRLRTNILAWNTLGVRLSVLSTASAGVRARIPPSLSSTLRTASTAPRTAARNTGGICISCIGERRDRSFGARSKSEMFEQSAAGPPRRGDPATAHESKCPGRQSCVLTQISDPNLSRFGTPNRPNYALLAGLARRLGMVALPVHTGAVVTRSMACPSTSSTALRHVWICTGRRTLWV